jgi:predicted metalloendopeptidase
MSPETKAQAKDKLTRFTVKIAYPTSGATTRRSTSGAATCSATRCGRTRSSTPM